MTRSALRILVADDDPTVGLLMRTVLSAPDFSLVLVDSGNDALAEFNRGEFDMVLLDVEMPGMDGFEVCAAIREGRGAKLPVVLISGHRDAQFAAQAAAIGAKTLSKPVDWSSLAAWLYDLQSQHEAGRSL